MSRDDVRLFALGILVVLILGAALVVLIVTSGD